MQLSIAGKVLSQRRDSDSVICKKSFAHQLRTDFRRFWAKDQEVGKEQAGNLRDFVQYAFTA